jgi:hypothetical protein
VTASVTSLGSHANARFCRGCRIARHARLTRAPKIPGEQCCRQDQHPDHAIPGREIRALPVSAGTRTMLMPPCGKREGVRPKAADRFSLRLVFILRWARYQRVWTKRPERSHHKARKVILVV